MVSKLQLCAMSNTAIFLFLYSTDFMLSWYVAKVFPKWSWEGSRCLYYYWYHFCFYIIIIKIADNISAIPLLELCSKECSEVTIKGLNDKWATYVLENLLLMDVTSIWGGGSFNVLFPRIWPNKYRGTVCIATLFMLFVKTLLRERKSSFFLWQIENHTQRHMAQRR
jgi:hypothetical protein